MPKKYAEIVSEYDQFKRLNPETSLDIAGFSKFMDADELEPQRQEAYNAKGIVKVAKTLNSVIDSEMENTGLPQAAGWLAGGVDELAGAAGFDTKGAAEMVGEQTPRMLLEGLMTAPLGGAAAGARGLNTIRRVGQALGYGSAATRGTAQTDSLAGGAIEAGMTFGMNKLLAPGGALAKLSDGAAAKVADAVAPDELVLPEVARATSDEVIGSLNPSQLIQPGRALPVLAKGAVDVAGTTLGNEVTRQAQLSVGPNAVGATDPSRNPLTAENIAGNIVGSAGYGVQIGRDVINAPRFNTDNVTRLNDWLKNREDFVTQEYLNDPASYEGEANPQEYIDTFNSTKKVHDRIIPPAKMDQMVYDPNEVAPLAPLPSDNQRYATLFKSQLSNLAHARKEGRLDDAQQAESALYRIKNLTGEKMPSDFVARAETLDAVARMAPPETVTGFKKFVSDLNGLIDEWNTNSQKLSDAQKTEKTAGESWHPQARDPKVIEQLGLLEPITEDWLKNEYHATFDHSGNPEFAYRVVLQKVANRVLGGVEGALAKRAEMGPQAQTEFSPKVEQILDEDRAFIESLLTFPDEIRDALAQRTAEVYSSADRKVQSKSGKSVQMNQRRGWEQAIVQAARTYDPATGMVTLKMKKGGQPESMKVEALFTRDENGNYAWEPPLKSPRVIEGRRSPVESGSLEERNLGQRGDDFDEDAPFFSELEKSESKALLDQLAKGELKGITKSELSARGEVAETAESLGDVRAETTGLEDAARAVVTAVEQQDPMVLWDKTKDLFVRKSMLGTPIGGPEVEKFNAFRQKHLKTALGAALEDLKATGTKVGPKGKELIAAMVNERGFNATTNTKNRNERKVLREALTGFLGAPGKADDIAIGKTPFDKRLYQFVSRLVEPSVLDPLMGKKPEIKAEGMGAKEYLSRHGHTLTRDPQSPGFSRDVARTMRPVFKKRLSEFGYSGSILDTYTEMATALALTKKGYLVDFYQLQSDAAAGLAAPNVGSGLAAVGVRMTEPAPATKAVNDMIRVLAHELSHIDQFIAEGSLPKPDAMSDEELRATKNLMRLGEVLAPEERHTILKTLEDTFVPGPFQSDIRSPENPRLVYGAQSAGEFFAQTNAFVAQSLYGGVKKGKFSPLDVLDYLPSEVSEYIKGRYRVIGDVLDAMKQTIVDPVIRQELQMAPLPASTTFTAEALDAAVQTARSMSKLRNADYLKAESKQLLASLDRGAMGALGPTKAVWNFDPKVADPYDQFKVEAMGVERGQQAVDQASKFLFGDKSEKNTRPSLYDRFLVPFTNLMFKMERAGIPLARDVWNLTQDIHPAIGRVHSQMLESFITRGPDGKLRPDDAGALLTKLNEDPNGNWRKALNRVREAQNKNGHKQMFIVGEKGIVPADEKMQAEWSRISRGLSSEDQQLVQNFSLAMDKTYQTAAGHLTGGLMQSLKNRTAAVMMTINRGMDFSTAQKEGARVVDMWAAGREGELAQTMPPVMFQSLQGLLGGKDGLIATFNQVREHLMSRPGFSSEQLPGDWIIRYKTKDGETLYNSAQSQRHAELVANRLVSEGNQIQSEIFNKKEIGKYNEFDSPDDVLTKFIAVENKSWDRFLTDYEAKNGQAAAQLLRESFVPGESSARELESKGLKKYLKENKSRVDTSRFDYLDAMNDYAANLSTSLVYRSIRQQLNLILNDPRAKGYPSFQNIVKEQFDYMMSPNPAGLNEMKSLMVGYYLGANISSALIEGTQSATTLVPTLIRLDNEAGPVKAWKMLGNGVANLFKVSGKDWLQTVRNAEGRDMKTWTKEESILSLYQRAVKDGIVELGVIQDPDYGRDQRALWTSRFSHGDYGGMDKMSMVKNKVYLASQKMMKLYSLVSHQNNKLAILAGLEQGYEKGLRGDELYRHAQLVKSLSTFGGGKANSVGLATEFKTPMTRSAYGLVSTLQQYGLGTIATYAELGRESIGKAKGLSPIERRQAIKSFGTMLITQVAIGGALSLPMAGAAIAFLENFFGIEAGAAVREGLASLAGDDEELGSTIADTALNGAGNQFLGIDLSSRVGVSNLFGTSAYRGFNAADMLGPVGGIIGNTIEALNLFGQQEPMKAARSLVPAAFKNALEVRDTMEKYGDTGFRDKSGSLLYQPSTAETARYLLGFRPSGLSKKRAAQHQLALSEQNYQRQRDHKFDSAARDLLGGNPVTAISIVDDLVAADPLLDRGALLKSIINRAADAVVEKDLLASGSYGNAANARQIAGNFGAETVKRRSETELVALKEQLGMMIGDPSVMPGQSAWERAQMVDQFVSQGMSRAEALRMIEFLGL